jgi:hypothetical protein
MAYAGSLQALLGAAGGGGGGAPSLGTPPPNPASLGMGTPPSLPGLPPPPTGMGAMPTGDPATTKKAAADQAILALREAKGHYPSLGSMLDATDDALKTAATGAEAGKPPAIGSPQPPGEAGMEAAPIMETGSPGPM